MLELVHVCRTSATQEAFTPTARPCEVTEQPNAKFITFIRFKVDLINLIRKNTFNI